LTKMQRLIETLSNEIVRELQPTLH
jgi:hypothetical protein